MSNCLFATPSAISYQPTKKVGGRLDLVVPHLMYPLEPEPVGVVARDLGEGGVAPSGVVARVRQPATRLAVGIEYTRIPT